MAVFWQIVRLVKYLKKANKNKVKPIIPLVEAIVIRLESNPD